MKDLIAEAEKHFEATDELDTFWAGECLTAWKAAEAALAEMKGERDDYVAEIDMHIKDLGELQGHFADCRQERDRLRDGLEKAQNMARTMRKSRKLMGPREYEHKPAFMRIWCKTREQEGRELAKICSAALTPEPESGEAVPETCSVCNPQFNLQDAIGICRRPDCPFAQQGESCETCGGSGTVYTHPDETEIGCPPGSSARPCPDCSQ